MKKNFINDYKYNSIFIKTFITLILSSIIPVIAGNAIILKQSTDAIQKQAYNSNMNMLNKTSAAVDLVFKQIDQIIPQIAKDSNIINFIINPDTNYISRSSKIVSNLRNITTTNKYILSIYVYSAHSRVIFSSDGGMYNIDEFYDKDWLQYYRDCFFETNRLETRKISDALGNRFNCITFIRNLPYSSWDKLGAVVININEDKLYNTITGIDNKGETFVTNSDGLILSHHDKSKLYNNIKSFSYADKILSYKEGYFVESINSESTLFTYMTSEYNDWKYIYTIPLKKLQSGWKAITTMVIVTTLLCILLCLILSFLISKGIYNPILNLMNIVTKSYKHLSADKKLSVKNEYEFLGYFYKDVIDKNRNMEVIIENAKPTIKDKLFTNLIMGNIDDSKEISEKLSFLNIVFNSTNFFVIVMQIDDYNQFDIKYNEAEKSLYKIELIRKVEDIIKAENNGTCLEVEKDKIAAIINFSNNLTIIEAHENSIKLAAKIKTEVEKYMVFTATLGIGRIYEDIKNLRLSYREALKALKYKLYQGKNEVINIDSVETKSDELYYYSFEKEKMLINNVKVGNRKETEKLIDDIFEHISYNRNVSYNYIQQLFIRIISNIVELIINLGMTVDEVFGPERNLYEELSNIETIKDIKSWLMDVCLSVVNSVNELNLVRTNKNVEKILEYVNKNMKNDISLNDIAELVGLSPTYVSKIFKDNIGINYVDYINRERVEKAKQLLKETKLNIEEIGFRVGFNNIQTFMRIFKKYEGITPGQYRNRT